MIYTIINAFKSVFGWFNKTQENASTKSEDKTFAKTLSKTFTKTKVSTLQNREFKLFSWNVLNPADKYQVETFLAEKYETINNQIKLHSPDVIALQECPEDFVDNLPKLHPDYVWHTNGCYNNWYVIIGTKGESTLHSKLNFVDSKSSGKGMISVKWNSHIVSCIHLPFLKKGGYESFDTVLQTLGENVLIAGDFNVCDRATLPPGKHYWDCLEKLFDETSSSYLKHDENTDGSLKTLKGELKNYDHLVFSEKYSSTSFRCWDAENAFAEGCPSDHVPTLYTVQCKTNDLTIDQNV